MEEKALMFHPSNHNLYGGGNMNYNLLPNEEIKIIDQYPNYLITSFGRVWSNQSQKWLTPTINKRGNHQRDEVDHIDTNGLNNHADNLRWVTHQQNMDNEITKEMIKQNTGYYCEIEEIATGKLFIGYQAAAKYSGLHEETIRNHTKNKVKNPKWRLTGKRIRPED